MFASLIIHADKDVILNYVTVKYVMLDSVVLLRNLGETNLDIPWVGEELY